MDGDGTNETKEGTVEMKETIPISLAPSLSLSRKS